MTGSGVTDAEDDPRSLVLQGNELRKSVFLVPASLGTTNETTIGLQSLDSDDLIEWDRYVNVEILGVTETNASGQPTPSIFSVSSSHTVRILDSDGISATSNNNVDFDERGYHGLRRLRVR